MKYYKLKRQKNLYDEYVIRAFEISTSNPSPIHIKEADYFTNDWDDALGTLNQIALTEGLEVKRITPTHYIAS